MSWLINVGIIWATGSLVWFRWDAWTMIKRRNMRRDEAIKSAARAAPWWFVLVLVGVVYGIVKLVTSGLPESRADRDAAIKELERDVLPQTLQDALEATTTAEDARDEAAGQPTRREADEESRDMAFAQMLHRHRTRCGPDTVMPSGKTMARLNPAYRPQGYRDEVAKADEVLDLLHKLAALGVETDPTTGDPVHISIIKARAAREDARSGHNPRARLTPAEETRRRRLDRFATAAEIQHPARESALQCSVCGCAVVPIGNGQVTHTPDLGGPFPCAFATVGPVLWHRTPEGSPERAAVRDQAMEALQGKLEAADNNKYTIVPMVLDPRNLPQARPYLEAGTTSPTARPYLDPRGLPTAEEEAESAKVMAELQREFPLEEEPETITSISLDGTETVIPISGPRPRRRSTYEVHKASHNMAPGRYCPFCISPRM